MTLCEVVEVKYGRRPGSDVEVSGRTYGCSCCAEDVEFRADEVEQALVACIEEHKVHVARHEKMLAALKAGGVEALREFAWM